MAPTFSSTLRSLNDGVTYVCVVMIVYGYFFVRLHRKGFGFQANILVERVTTHLRWFGEDLGSGAVSWLDERSIELGHHWFDVAHSHYHPPLPIPFRRY